VQTGEGEDSMNRPGRADDCQGAIPLFDPFQRPEEHTKAGGIHESHLLQIDDEMVLPLPHEFGKTLLQLRSGEEIDLSSDLQNCRNPFGLSLQVDIDLRSPLSWDHKNACLPFPEDG
jgi:hypothetical protein